MSDDFHKFLFLGAVMALAMLSSRAAIYPSSDASSRGAVEQQVPTFILTTPSESALQGSQAALVATGGDVPPPPPVPSSTDPISQSGPQASVASGDVSPLQQDLTSPALQSPVLTTTAAFSKISDAAPPDLTANIFAVADLSSGEVLISKGPGKRWPIASITKLMTAAIAWDFSFTASTTLTASNFPVGDTEKDVNVGDRYYIADLMRIMLMESSNIAADALASFQNRDQFIAAMNARAAEWGMSTRFADATGLSPANQATIDDLLKLATHIYAQYPDILKTTKKLSTTVTELNSGRRFTVKNIDLEASRPDFLGGKTGFIDESGGNLMAFFAYENRPIVTMVLGSDDRFGDTEKLLSWFEANYK